MKKKLKKTASGLWCFTRFSIFYSAADLYLELTSAFLEFHHAETFAHKKNTDVQVQMIFSTVRFAAQDTFF